MFLLYMKAKILGNDSTSIVYDIGNDKVIKISKNGKSLEKEARIQSKLPKNIAPKIFSYRDNWIIMEKMDGTLYDIIKEHEADKPLINMIKKFAKISIKKSIKIMHGCGIIHNDLKLSNIFYKLIDNEFKFYIGDFGMATTSKKNLNDANILMDIMFKRWNKSRDIKFTVNEIFNTSRFELETSCV